MWPYKTRLYTKKVGGRSRRFLGVRKGLIACLLARLVMLLIAPMVRYGTVRYGTGTVRYLTVHYRYGTVPYRTVPVLFIN